MPVTRVTATAQGVIAWPPGMKPYRHRLTRLVWVRDGQGHDYRGTGFWWMALGPDRIKVSADVRTGDAVEVHYE
jgi:hypothetical protein